MKSIRIKTLSILLFGWLVSTGMFARRDKYTSDWASIDSRPVPQWFTDAKFGIFIHWGVYSVPAWGPLYKDGAKNVYECYSEHYWNRLANNHPLFVKHHREMYGESFKYQDFAADFKCEMYNPVEWAKLFRDAGARYVVLTSKHHDGYTLWQSEYAWNWNAVDVGPHRDILGDLTVAVRDAGLHMGYYYSLLEWFNPLYRKDVDTYAERHLIPQMKELVNRYSPDIFWTDGEWDYSSDKLRSTDFLAWLYNESPVRDTVVVNDRWGKETRSKHGGFYTTEYDNDAEGASIEHPWEECRGIGSSFGYNRNENLEDYSSSEKLVHTLIEKVAQGGNLLLNVGPTADGRIPVIMQQRLSDMGAWLKVNGEAIYATKPWSAASENTDASVYYTTKGKDLYVIFTKYPEKSVTIKGITGKPVSVEMLGSDVKVSYAVNGKNLTIHPPVMTINKYPCNYAWTFKVSGGI
jgi:alpha-L-fucosidase